MDVLDKDYRRHAGKRFGLDAEGGWIMRALSAEEMDEPMDEDGSKLVERRIHRIGNDSIPDLNKAVYTQYSEVNNLALIPFLPREQGRQHMGHIDVRRDEIVPGMRHPLRLFGFKIELSVGDERVSQEPHGGGEENIVLSLTSEDFGELAREQGILLGL